MKTKGVCAKFPFSTRTRALLKQALSEDLGRGDLTSKVLVPESASASARIVAREGGVFCGSPVVNELCRVADPNLKLTCCVKEGKKFRRGGEVLRLEGSARSILAVERTLLNFLGHLCGIATRTRQFLDRVRRYQVFILDTRKTTPLWREIEKYAVSAGGGRNHRMGLYDAVFIKENHRPFADFSALKNRRGRFEIEVRNLKELKDALKLDPAVILFDNFKPAALKQGVRLARALHPEVILEASGGITLENVSAYAAMGVDWISVGSLTHSVRSLDFSLLVE